MNIAPLMVRMGQTGLMVVVMAVLAGCGESSREQALEKQVADLQVTVSNLNERVNDNVYNGARTTQLMASNVQDIIDLQAQVAGLQVMCTNILAVQK